MKGIKPILVELHRKAKGKCEYCGCNAPLRKPLHKRFGARDTATVDHIVPRAKGGTSYRANLALACRGCNNLKADMSLEDFKRIMGAKWTGQH